MLSLSANVRIFLHVPPTDMRKSFEGLSGLVRSAFHADPLDGSLFLFVNRRRDRIKILYWDRDGLALWYKRLEAGTFEVIPAGHEDSQAEVIVAEHKRRQQGAKKPRQEQLPDHLPRYEVEAKVPAEVKHCEQHGERKLIGYDRTETLEFERPKLKVRVTLYPKYVCEDEPSCGVSQPERLPGLVEGNRYDTSIAAEIITGKCGYHLPIYRQQDYFAGSGWIPDRSTLLNIQRAAAELVEPFVHYLRDEVLASGLLGTDDTRVTLLLPPEIPEAKVGDAKSQRIHEVFREARAAGKPSVSGRMWAYRSLLLPICLRTSSGSHREDGPDAPPPPHPSFAEPRLS